MEKNNLLSIYQHGFRANRSTETAILEFINNVYRYLEDKCYAVGIFMDLSKAFDSLNHQILFGKLQYFGIRGIPYQLIKNYMCNRSQAVYCNSQYFHSRIIANGIPRGSILGPILFLIYINDISNASNSFEFTIYADDTNMLLGDKDIHNLHSNLSTELNLVYNWIKVNRLKLNISKTNFILFQN